MNKIKVEDMACFEQVAKVIGVTNAKRELFIAIKSYKGMTIKTHGDLSIAFYWSFTIQRYKFWHLINIGINPYNQ